MKLVASTLLVAVSAFSALADFDTQPLSNSVKQTYSNEPTVQCDWQDKSLSVGDSLWVEDPFLADQLIERMSAQGASYDKIQHRLKHNDYTGFRVECLAEVQFNPDPDKPGQVLSQVRGVMVINEYGRDYHQHLINEAQ